MMIKVGLSDGVLKELPTLQNWLNGSRLQTVRIEKETRKNRSHICVFLDHEIKDATHRDIIITPNASSPELVRASHGLPLRIAFGFQDMAFGYALIAEAIRGGTGLDTDRISDPAIGEPDTADLMTFAARVAQSDATVLITGATGVGKEGMANFIHRNSGRADQPFIPVNCAALPETMVEAMLFGHKKGSFTGATSSATGLFKAADGGTIFLDEITELPLALQAKLLRVIQEGEILPVGETQPSTVDVRIITAANRDFDAEVAAGNFREDLFWRLNVMPVHLKPLAERRQDIRAITAAMLLKMQVTDEKFVWLSHEALQKLMAHKWPGNARELNNVLQRALILRSGDWIEAEDLDIPVTTTTKTPLVEAAPAKPSKPIELDSDAAVCADWKEATRKAQLDAIAEALERTGGHRQQAAEQLGISERTLRYRLAEMRELAA